MGMLKQTGNGGRPMDQQLQDLDFVYEEADVIIDEANDHIDMAEDLAKESYPDMDRYLRSLSVDELSNMVAVIVIGSITEDA
jgi:hypothetical protein